MLNKLLDNDLAEWRKRAHEQIEDGDAGPGVVGDIKRAMLRFDVDFRAMQAHNRRREQGEADAE